ncbi:MAG: hypothetical protein K6C40_11925, partial [Thermoguttaceae bacterium]|nr:hypothetical protein [Thermoguttaceae bacterium]
EKVTPPAEKASAESTANLAHDRLKGHNPTAAIRANDNDPTLRPDPQEIARLNEFEGRKTPDWAVGALPSAPEASAPIPSERIAQNVNEQTLAAESSNPSLPAPSNPNLLEDGLPDSVDSLPGTNPQMANLPSTLPESLDANAPSALQAGDVMTELPGTLDGNTVQASATQAPGTVPNAAQPIPAVPAPQPVQTPQQVQPQQPVQTLPQAQPPQPVLPQTQVQPQQQNDPPVLFMPGNINPQYPNTPTAR